MKVFKQSLNIAILTTSFYAYSQNNGIHSQPSLMQRQHSNIGNQMNIPYSSRTGLHSKFIVSKQRQINGFKKLIDRDNRKIAEMELEIETLEKQLVTSIDIEKDKRKLKRRQNWLDAIKREKQKFEQEVNIMEAGSEITDNSQK